MVIYMKQILRTLFSPVLNVFEKGTDPYSYKPMHRKILIVVSILFLSLAMLVLYLMPVDADTGYLLPVVVFSTVAVVGLVVGLLGTDRAVSRIWGNR